MGKTSSILNHHIATTLHLELGWLEACPPAGSGGVRDRLPSLALLVLLLVETKVQVMTEGGKQRTHRFHLTAPHSALLLLHGNGCLGLAEPRRCRKQLPAYRPVKLPCEFRCYQVRVQV